MARNSAKNSAKFARKLSIRAGTECSYCTTASGNLVVDRTDEEVAQVFAYAHRSHSRYRQRIEVYLEELLKVPRNN
jgi:hypothetical protein